MVGFLGFFLSSFFYVLKKKECNNNNNGEGCGDSWLCDFIENINFAKIFNFYFPFYDSERINLQFKLSICLMYVDNFKKMYIFRNLNVRK